MLAGTDFPLGSDVFLQLQAELRVMVFYKQWTPYQALLTAIRNPAKLLGIQDDLGSLEVGKLADIIMVEGNPLVNIDDTINVKGTMVNGIYRTVEEIIAPFPTQGNSDAAAPASAGLDTGRKQASLTKGRKQVWLAPVPDHPSNRAFWWHRPEWVKDDFSSRES